jgi:NAD(P)-dependent dehydrogenase (short-subunit alcohol dehydrogenase family)
MDLQIRSRTALVTGGSKGIGEAIAKRLAIEGCNVVLVARSQTELEAAAQRIRAEGGGAVSVLPADLGAPGAIAAIAQAWPHIDILVNNAGDIPGGTIEELTDAAVRDSWGVKVFGYMDLCRHYLPAMKKQGGGVILNVIGVAGEMVDAGYVAGCAGNAALIAMTKAIGSTSIDAGVRVLGINPGPVATERLTKILRKRAGQRLGDAERWRELAAQFPGGRPAHVDEIAAMAALLCSPLSGYTTGAVVNIDGGLSSRHSIG